MVFLLRPLQLVLIERRAPLVFFSFVEMHACFAGAFIWCVARWSSVLGPRSVYDVHVQESWYKVHRKHRVSVREDYR